MNWKRLIESSVQSIGVVKTAERVGLSRRQLTNLRKGESEPTPETRDKIIAALGNTADMAKQLKDSFNGKELAYIMAQRATIRKMAAAAVKGTQKAKKA